MSGYSLETKLKLNKEKIMNKGNQGFGMSTVLGLLLVLALGIGFSIAFSTIYESLWIILSPLIISVVGVVVLLLIIAMGK